MPSDITTMPDTPAPGTGLDSAAASIADLLARDSGEPGVSAARQPRATAPAADAPPSDPEGETPIAAEELDPELEIDAEADAAEDADDAAEPDTAQTLVTIEIDGKEQRLPLAEVTRGYLRQADYARKTQALAAERQSFGEEAGAVRQERLQYAQLLPALAWQIQQMQGPEPDWARLKEDDPVGYMLQRDEWRDRQARVDAARQEYERVREAEAIATDDALRTRLRDEGALLVQAMPAWRDRERRDADRARVRDYGRKLGWSEAELSSVTDHRAVLVLYKAMQYDAAMQKRLSPAPPRPRAPAPQPGAQRPPASRQVAELTRAKQRLAQSNSLRDARAVIEQLL
ncbi:MAG TPA: hypothetical protein VGM87_17425 [Roseomonas sp.]|jgi:hypothetical protein